MDRLREILLRQPKGLTLYEMAEALGVTPRTMRRYMKELDRALELESEATRGGGPRVWKIRSGELPRKVELRRTQAYAFLAARRVFAPLEGSTLYEEIDMAVSKLLAFSRRPGRGPNAGRADARLEDRFLYLPFAPKNYAEKTEELDDLFQAVADLRPLSLRYRSLGKAREESIVIHPYAMVLHRDSIYCVGFHTGHGEVRTFVLDRMRDTQIGQSEHFELPEDFKVDEYFHGELGVFRSEERHEVVVDFDAQGAEYVRMRTVHPSQRLQALPGGGVRLSMTVGSLNPVTSWVLEWGARARVVEPPELVERVQSELRQALEGYDAPQPKRGRRPRAPQRAVSSAAR
jgi:predicted DNA-binding transcriptional regulator YafY